MSDFFDVPAVVPEPERDPPPWAEPPRDVVAALVADRRVLMATDRVSVILTHIDAYPTGAGVRLLVMARRVSDMTEADWRRRQELVWGRSGPPAPDEGFRVGVQISDGRKATNLDHGYHGWPIREPSGPSLIEYGRGGRGHQQLIVHGRNLWLWPLPPPEPFDLVVEWPALGVPLTRSELDGAAIVAAAAACRPAWN